MSIRWLQGDCRETLRTLPVGSVQCVVTSPPYYGLRDYGLPQLVWGGDAEHEHEWTMTPARLQKSMNGQGATTLSRHGDDGRSPQLDAVHLATRTLPDAESCSCGAWRGSHGLEPTPELYIQHAVEVFREVRRVLRDDGTLWLNLGSSYAGSGNGQGDNRDRDASISLRQLEPSARDNDPSQSRRRKRGQPYGNDDTTRSDSQDSGFAYRDLCDGCRAVIAGPNHRSADNDRRSHVYASQLSQIARDTARKDYDPESPVALLPDAPESTTEKSSPRPPGECYHCSNCGACLSVLRSSSRDSRLCVRRLAYNGGTFQHGDSSDSHSQGREFSSTARIDCTIPRQFYKPKDEMLIPFRVALALQNDGWFVRSVIPWLKKSSMPESVRDRPATAVEYVFLLSKSARYFWDPDAVREPYSLMTTDGSSQRRRMIADRAFSNEREFAGRSTGRRGGVGERMFSLTGNGRSRRNSDWFFESWQGLMLDEHDDPLALIVNPQPFKEAHFATFPAKLVEPMVKAGTSEKGQCPECGAPWVRMTERKFYGSWNDHGQDDIEKGARQLSGQSFKGTDFATEYQPPRTTGWRPTCTHTDAWCPICQTVIELDGGWKAITHGNLSDVRQSVSRVEERQRDILQSAMLSEPTEEDSADTVSQLSESIYSKEHGREVLQSPVCRQIHLSKTSERTGVVHHHEGLPSDLSAGPPSGTNDGVRYGTSSGNGEGAESSITSRRSRASQKRGEDGQPSGEPRGNVQKTARQRKETDIHGSASELSSRVPDTGQCSCCGGRLEFRPLTPQPQVILDCFGGSGTTGLVADRLGRNAILCELNPTYSQMGTTRIVNDAPLFTELSAD